MMVRVFGRLYSLRAVRFIVGGATTPRDSWLMSNWFTEKKDAFDVTVAYTVAQIMQSR